MTSQETPFSLVGKRALVCASTGGLGEAIARGLAAAGARVAISGRRLARAEEIASDLDGAIAIRSDLSMPDAAEELADAVAQRLGGVDILVLNGPGPAPVDAQNLDDDSLDAAMGTLFCAQRQLVSTLLPAMRENRWGRIVAVGSTGMQAPIAGLASSNAARWAFAGYAKTLAGEVAADGVTVNLVLPGRIATDRITALDHSRAERANTTPEEIQRASIATIPAGRYGRPEEFAAPVVFLSSPAASYITGIALRCDGGMIPVL